jgi:UDP-N-acetylglucosamine 4,6-dehydratase
MRVFITGITGTLGTALTEYHHGKGDQVWGCARNESRAVEWLRKHGKKATLFVQCATSLSLNSTDSYRALQTMDRVYHCAAMKHVDLCEKQPIDAVWNNLGVTDHVVTACYHASVPLVFASTDKACHSQGVYGATKLIAERMVLREGGSVVRLVNLIGSSGSVFPLWQKQVKEGKPLTITDPDMTRYFMPVRTAAQFMAENALAGKVVIPYCRSVRMGDVVTALVANLSGKDNVTKTGSRPGESRQQWLIAPGDTARPTDHAYVLGEGSVWTNGKNSDEGPWWDVSELLQEAIA